MDDLKRQIKEIAKYSFWIISGLVLLLSSVIFYLTSTSMYSSISQRISTVNGVFSKINEVGGKAATHPNELSHKEMEKRLEGLVSDVDQAWQFQYERQKDFLTWPQNAFQYPKVHEIFDSLRPFEKRVAFPLPEPITAPLDQITVQDRKVYKDYIEPEFPALAKRIGSTWKFVLDQKSMTPGGNGFEPPSGIGGFGPPGLGGLGGAQAGKLDDTKDLVRWSEASQKELISTAMPWYARTSPPTVHEIYYTQEDIWILRGLMDILANTNSEAKENFQAVVREIEWIRWGAKASRDAGSLSAGGAAGGAGGMMGGMMGGGPPADYAGGGGGGGPPAGYGGMGGGGKGSLVPAAAAVRAKDPADGRYVDTSFKPLTGTQLRGAMNLQNATDAVIGVAKRIPVRMRLKIDESQLGRLITECGNGKMMLEVLQVRYNTQAASTGATAGFGGGGGGFGGDGSGEGGPPNAAGLGTGSGAGAGVGDGASEPESDGDGGGSGGMPGMPGLGGGAASRSTNGEVPIEIFGLIYLFNPPASLSSTKTAEGAPGTQPAADTAAPAPDAANANPPASADPIPPADVNPPADPGAAPEPASPADPNAPENPDTPADPSAPADPGAPANPGAPAGSVEPATGNN
ncbi:MAG: hypothetical protein ACK41S_01695 [Planctomycetota bacterium]|jgi:hypothetical protein